MDHNGVDWGKAEKSSAQTQPRGPSLSVSNQELKIPKIVESI